MASGIISKSQKILTSNSAAAVRRHIHDFGANVKPLKISFLGAPFDRGQPHAGLNQSPDLLRKSGVLEYLKSIGHDVRDEGDVVHVFDEARDPAEKAKNFDENVAYNKKLSEKVSEIVRSDRICVTVGGDHAIGVGTVYGHASSYLEEDRMCLIWVDAHGDIETPEVSPSKNMHGMPVSFHVKEMFQNDHYPEHLEQLKWFKPCLRAQDIVFIGLRDVLPCEVVFFQKYGIPAFTMKEVDQLGIKEVVRQTLQMINPNGDRPIHVSFDIDALDPLEAPATGTKVNGGLSLREGLTLLEMVHETGCLRGLDVVEVNPALAKNDDEIHKTVDAAKRLILAAAGFPRGVSAI